MLKNREGKILFLTDIKISLWHAAHNFKIQLKRMGIRALQNIKNGEKKISKNKAIRKVMSKGR